MIVPVRRRAPAMRNYHVRGMGEVPRPNYESCQPWDGPCVQRNTDKGNAWALATAGDVAKQNYDQCLANAKMNIGAPNYDSIRASCDAAYSGAASDAGQTAATPVTWGPPPPEPVHTVPVPVTLDMRGSSGGNVAPPVVVNSSGAATVPATTQAAATTPATSTASTATSSSFSIGGYDLSALPWYVWAGAAGVAWFAFGGGGRGR